MPVPASASTHIGAVALALARRENRRGGSAHKARWPSRGSAPRSGQPVSSCAFRPRPYRAAPYTGRGARRGGCSSHSGRRVKRASAPYPSRVRAAGLPMTGAHGQRRRCQRLRRRPTPLRARPMPGSVRVESSCWVAVWRSRGMASSNSPSAIRAGVGRGACSVSRGRTEPQRPLP
jgi:hypothetical protein